MDFYSTHRKAWLVSSRPNSDIVFLLRFIFIDIYIYSHRYVNVRQKEVTLPIIIITITPDVAHECIFQDLMIEMDVINKET